MSEPLHSYMIDDDGARWCGDQCPAESPHWQGEPENVYKPGWWGEPGGGPLMGDQIHAWCEKVDRSEETA